MSDDDLSQAQRRLNAARARKRRADLGPPLDLDDAALDTLSTVGPHDMASVEAFIRDAAGEVGVAMFRAKREA